MSPQTLHELLKRRPFEPFRVVMSGGQTYDIRHPEMAFLTLTNLLVGIDSTDDGIPAQFKICALLHITAVEPLDPAAAGPPPR